MRNFETLDRQEIACDFEDSVSQMMLMKTALESLLAIGTAHSNYQLNTATSCGDTYCLRCLA